MSRDPLAARRPSENAWGLARAEAAAWAVVLVVAVAALGATRYTSRDPDSSLYAEMSAYLSTQPIRSWIALDWGQWGEAWDKSGYFREHPIGIFVLPSLLARLGYPAEQAAFAVGALFSALAIGLWRPVVAPLVRAHESRAVQWAALILPVAFVYRIRANQEYPVLVCLLVALYATERARRAPAWMAGVAGAACALVLVKDIFVVFLPALCALWLLIVPRASKPDAPSREGRDMGAWIGVALSVVTIVATAWVYDRMFRQATGDSFFSYFLYERLADNAGLVEGQTFSVAARFYNVAWYLVRVLWFGVPGTFVLLAAAPRLRQTPAASLRGVWFVVLATAMYVGAFSLGANKADRFIFPAYFFVGVAGAVVATRRWARVDDVARRLERLPAFSLPAAWLALFLLTLATSR